MYIYHHVVHFKYVILVLSYTSVKLEKNEKENASLQEKSLENSKKHKILQVKIKEGCWCFWTVGEDSSDSLGQWGDKPVNLKRNQSWIFIGRTNAEAPILWPPDVKTWLIGKDPDTGKDWRQEEKGMTEDEMAGWHHWLDGHEFEQAPGVGDGQGSLVCCSPWGRKESDTTEWLNINKNKFTILASRIFKKDFL